MHAATAPEVELETYEQSEARLTKQIVTVSAILVLVVLVFFLAMMFILSGYNPEF